MLKNLRKRILDAMRFRGYFERKRLEKEARLQDLENERERIINEMDLKVLHGEEIFRRLQTYEADPAANLRRQQWFRVKQRMAQYAWDQVADETVRLKIMDEYLMPLNENCRFWHCFPDSLKNEVLSWVEGVNSVTADLHYYMRELKAERRRNLFTRCL